LLADDHEVVRQALKALLERHGFQVVGEAADGRAAVDAACRLRPDIAVLDVAMPLLNGVDAARELCRMSPATRVILLTALEDAHFVPEALQAGARGLAMKPPGTADLGDCRALPDEGAAAPPPRPPRAARVASRLPARPLRHRPQPPRHLSGLRPAARVTLLPSRELPHSVPGAPPPVARGCVMSPQGTAPREAPLALQGEAAHARLQRLR